MAILTRNAGVVWEGSIARGGGKLTSGSETLSGLDVTLPGREHEEQGQTSPEELLAASHATCFTMALGSILAAQRTPPTRLATEAVCGLETTPGRRKVEFIELTVTGVVEGIDERQFAGAVREAEKMCPISKALTGNVEIRANSTLHEVSAE